jgi:cytidylate kinase
MYRAVTWKALRQGMDLSDEAALEALSRGMRLDMRPDPDSAAGHRLLVDDLDITSELHSPEVSQAVPRVASVPGVRRDMVLRQQSMAEQGGVIMAGRDIGTVVMPQARLKFYLDADLAERARRRRADLVGEGRGFSQEEVSRQLQERDNIDSTRNDSPLRVADDAERLDCTTYTAEQVVDLIAARYREVWP